VRQTGPREKAALGTRRHRTAIIHRTVRRCTGLSGEPTVASANVRPSNPRATRGSSNGRQGAPDCPVCTGQCPVRHSTEGKDGFPSLPPTAPSCLGAIKGTPRRMEELPKHSLSILKHPDSTLAHSLHCVSDLGSIRVVHSLSCHLSSSLHLCAWLCCVFGSCVCCSSQPYFVLSL
jgi:hypothetical protein